MVIKNRFIKYISVILLCFFVFGIPKIVESARVVGVPQKIDTLGDHWITAFLLGTAQGNGYAQFPESYFWLLYTKSIDWEEDSLKGEKDAELIGTISLPRQYVYTYGATGFYSTDSIIMGADVSGVPGKNQLILEFKNYDKTEFDVSIKPKEKYKIKEVQINHTPKEKGEFADFVEYEIKVKRLKNAPSAEKGRLSLELFIEWRTNPWFLAYTWDISMWYENFTFKRNKVFSVETDGYVKQSAVNVKDSTIYAGDNWEPKDNFVNDTDENDKDIPFSEITVDDKEVDISKPGKFNVHYSYNNTKSTALITVKENKTAVQVTDSTIYVGDNWEPINNFIEAQDKDGKPLDFSKIKISGKVDTSRPDIYKVSYSYDKVSSIANITVKATPLELIIPDQINFGEYKLGSSQKKLFWEDGKELTVKAETNQGWSLSVALEESVNADFKEYLCFGDKKLGSESVTILEATGTKEITSSFPKEDFIYIDYSLVDQLREDVAQLKWTLTATSNKLKE